MRRLDTFDRFESKDMSETRYGEGYAAHSKTYLQVRNINPINTSLFPNQPLSRQRRTMGKDHNSRLSIIDTLDKKFT